MRSVIVTSLAVAATLALAGAGHVAGAQNIHIGPGGIDVRPGGRPPPRDPLRVRLFELRQACEAGDRHACVRFGIIIGENRARMADWRRENPELFFYER